jgi:glycosyltransferase involved in cell wall biosynthesis
MQRRPLVLLYVHHTLGQEAPSGVQRVARKLAENLPACADVELVKWDHHDGQLRYLDAADCRRLFPDALPPPGVRANPFAHRVNYRFGDTLPPGAAVWLLFPEIAYHTDAAGEVMTRVLAMCGQYGVRTAAVFYDAIPVTNVAYRALRRLHARYLAQLVRCDRIYAISGHSKRELERLYRRYLGAADQRLGALCARIVAAPLGEADASAAALPPREANARRNKVLLLGTVEPRKGQMRVLRAFNRVQAACAPGLELHVLGSLHPDVACAFNALVAASPGCRYHGYASAAEIDRLHSEARFSVFASDDEGFGLPICESLARGVPCLTAAFGAMAETAAGGGCLTVDVTDATKLGEAMQRLAADDTLLSRLRDEIGARVLRTWRDYAHQIAGDMAAASSAEAAAEAGLRSAVAAALEGCLGSDPPRGGRFPIAADAGGPPATLVVDVGDGADAAAPAAHALPGPAPPREIRVAAGEAPPSRPDPRRLARVCGADAWAFRSPDAVHALVEEARSAGCGPMLPPVCVVEPDTAALVDKAATAVARQVWAARCRHRVARRELLACDLAGRWPEARAPGRPRLTIVISTFNRARFVQENVRWLLGFLPKFGRDVGLMVVDNASTDDTLERLRQFAQAPQLTVVSNPVNVGMLGNLRVASALAGSRHVWVTGDDDFILPAGLAEVVDALDAHPETPFLFVNFGVYHRSGFGPDDSVPGLVAERAPLAADPSPSGFYPVVRIAEEHDNLFTAIYPIVFRSDLLAACFNYPFDGRPFADLVESVPTSKMLLETYGATHAYWCARMGIVGNVANSWSRHRPRWHAVLMPRVLQLARDAGADPARLQQWSAVHFELFLEARRRARADGVPLDIFPDELDAGYRVFRQPIPLA